MGFFSAGCRGMDWYEAMSPDEQESYLKGGRTVVRPQRQTLVLTTHIQDQKQLSQSKEEPRSDRSVDSIEIEGSSQFYRRVKNALNQIKGTKFESKVASLKKIREVATYDETGMGHDGVFDVALHILGHGTWAASQLVHDAEHYNRMQTGKYLGICREEEKAAFKPQAEFLASKGNIFAAFAVSMMDGSHADSRISS